MMEDLRVKVRICISHLSIWLLLLLVFDFVLESTTLPVSTPPRTELDRRCLSMGPNYVYDEGVGICVSCGSCQCEYIAGNPHCVKCLDYGILQCQTTTAPPVTAPVTAPVTETPLQETTPLPQTSRQTTVETPLMAFMTTMHQTITAGTNASNNDNSTWRTVVGVGVSLFVVIGLLGAAFLYKKRKSLWPKTNPATIRQDTQPPEAHPMTNYVEIPGRELEQDE